MKSFLSNKPLAAVAVLATAAALLSGCSSNSTTSSSGVTTISLWARDSEESFVPELAKGFNATHKNIQVKVTIIPGAQFTQKFATATAGDSAPDVTAMDLVLVPYYAKAGVLLDLSDKAKSLSYMSDFDSAHLGTIKWDSKTYALPFSAEASVLYYNKDLFKKAGLDPDKPPTTWAEIKTDADKITALGNGDYGFYNSGNCGGCNLFVGTPYLYANGANLLTTGASKSDLDFNSPASISAITFLNSLWKAGDMPKDAKSDTGANFYTTFETGKIGMQGGGAFGIGDLISKKKVDFGVTPIPGPTAGTKGSFAGGDDIVIPAGSKHPDAAWTFLKWATSVAAQKKYLADLGITPVRSSVATGYYSQKDPRLATLAQALQFGKTPVSPDVYAIFNDTGSPWNTLLQQGVFGDDPAGAAAAAQTASLKLITTGN